MSDPARRHDDFTGVQQAERLFPVRLSDNIRSAIINTDDPVALQYLPNARETIITPQERQDPIGDHAHSPVKGIVHRHPDRVLFKVASVCAVNCRFCFRKTMLGTPQETLSAAEIDDALAYIARTPAIWEVILTGGDPLILSQRRLQDVLDRIEAIPHVRIIRIHTRIPVADPPRITPELYGTLERKKPLYMVLHVNHAQELTQATKEALKNLHRIGIVLLSQSVLLKGVNDNADALESLFRALTELRVKPYYLHHPDMVPGTGHFRISIETGQALMRTLRTRCSGTALPTYVIDIPGGFGKIPLETAWVEKRDGMTILTDHKGNRHIYS